VADALTKAGLKPESSEITMIPDLHVPVNDKNQAAALLKFVEALEALDDVQNVYANFDIPDDVMAAVS
jgi:transcriptional/translational regulatory protein YebC/TACO1